MKGDPEPSRDIFVYRVDPSTSEENMMDYIVAKGLTVHNVECVSKPVSRYKSFCVTIPASQLNNAFEAAMWPEGVKMWRFLPQKNKSNQPR